MLRSGIKWRKLDADELCDVFYSMIIDDVSNWEIARVEARDKIDDRLKSQVIRENARQGIKTEPEPFRLDPSMAAKLGIRIPTPAKKQDKP